MLLVGDKTTIPEGYVVYNISSLVEGYDRVNIMPPLEIFQMCGQDEKLFDIKYADILLSYLFENFGVCVGTPVHPYSYNPAYNTRVCDILYYFGLMNAQELFTNYTEPLLNLNLIPLLIQEIHPYMGDGANPTFDDYVAYFNNYLQAVKRNNNTFLINPISKE